MSKEILSENPHSVQALARAAVDGEAMKRVNAIIQTALSEISVVLFRRERKASDRVTVDDIRQLGGEALVKSYEADAAMVFRMRDPQQHREAVYYAANAATPGGIGSLSLEERKAVIDQFEVGFRAYRDAQSNRAHPDVIARLGRLREADQAAAEAAPASLSSTGVH